LKIPPDSTIADISQLIADAVEYAAGSWKIWRAGLMTETTRL
jgi:hypothetical protein